MSVNAGMGKEEEERERERESSLLQVALLHDKLKTRRGDWS
jgi:hypothetical protein